MTDHMQYSQTPLPKLPTFRSHKLVQAAKITAITDGSGGIQFLTVDAKDEHGNQIKFGVWPEYVSKHKPRVGGYYVRYEDGYESWSPAEAFEGGYTRAEP